MKELFLAFLAQHDDAAWLRAIDRIQGAIHPVDRDATRIWFHFYPLALQQAMERPEAATLARRMTLAGRWRLADQIDSSHRFLYAHQYWPHAKRTVLDYVEGPTAPSSLDLGSQIQEIGGRIAKRASVGAPIVTPLAAVALRTVQHVGPDALAGSPGTVVSPGAYEGQSADDVLERRTRVPRRWFGLRPVSRRESSVTFDERDPAARFPIIHSQHVTTAAASDTRDFRQTDERCSEGPIPVHCRSCSCGTCWVGVLGGADALTPMSDEERAKLAECGVGSELSTAPIRLACQAQAAGPVSIVIPPWNGLVGRVLGGAGSGTPSSR